jgi:hypothetical protein
MDDEAERKRRAEQLRRKIGELKTPPQDPAVEPEQQPGESDAEYVQRRMREIDRKPRTPSS